MSKDFVEYPSQVNEMWGTDPELLAGYARHIETGEPLPADQIAALQVEGGSDQARETVSFLAATWLDLAWHRLTEAEVDDAVRDIDAFEARVLGEVGLDMAAIPPRYRSRYFNHIFSSGYAAGYYSYIWSEILDADTVEWFAEHRDRLREAGDTFRAELLSRGGSGDEMGYFEAFRGRAATDRAAAAPAGTAGRLTGCRREVTSGRGHLSIRYIPDGSARIVLDR